MNDKPMAARIIEYLIAGDSHLPEYIQQWAQAWSAE
jgi:hypothetical protein